MKFVQEKNISGGSNPSLSVDEMKTVAAKLNPSKLI